MLSKLVRENRAKSILRTGWVYKYLFREGKNKNLCPKSLQIMRVSDREDRFRYIIN